MVSLVSYVRRGLWEMIPACRPIVVRGRDNKGLDLVFNALTVVGSYVLVCTIFRQEDEVLTRTRANA